MTKTPSSPPSPNKSWKRFDFSFQNSLRSQCPRVHYHPWCDKCQTLMEWEPPQPIRPMYKRSIPTFGDLKTAVQARSCSQSPFKTQIALQSTIKKVCSTWREEQFARAVAQRCRQLVAREAVC